MACNCALSHTGGICGTIIGYAPVFYGILEFLQAGFPNHTRSCPFGRSCGMGVCKVSLSRKKILYTLYIVLMLMPFQVTMVSSYLVLNKLGLIDTVWAVILPGAASTLPVFIMTRFFMDIPAAVMEAAAVDGASSFQTFLRFGLPLGAPGILSAVVLGFLEYWNAIEAPQAFLKNQALWPLSLYMSNITADNAGVSLIASLITLMPPLLIFLSGQKYLEQGIISSGMKD